MTLRVIVPCGRYEGHPRHRWVWVVGTVSTPEHPYRERRCAHCFRFESEVR